MMLRSLCVSALLALSAAAAEPAKLVFMIGEDEYHTWETLPEFAQKDLKPLGYRTVIIIPDATDKHRFPGLVEALLDADLLFVSVRRRTPLAEELAAIRAHLAAGKPLIGIRTASHAFALRSKDKLTDPKLASWQEFDPEVLGGHYTNHHKEGPKTVVSVAPNAAKHPILAGIDTGKLVGNGSLYKVNPLVTGTSPLLLGTIPEQPSEALAWTNVFGPNRAKVFYTSLGHPDDFQEPEFRALLRNAIAWALGK